MKLIPARKLFLASVSGSGVVFALNGEIKPV